MNWIQAQEERDYELGAQLGDPRRCDFHPDVQTSSPDGLFDAPCWKCEAICDGADPSAFAPVARNIADPFGDLWAGDWTYFWYKRDPRKVYA